MDRAVGSNGNPDHPDEGGSRTDKDSSNSNEIEVVDLEALHDNPSGSGLHPDQDHEDVDAPVMEVDEVVVVHEVITLGDTDSSQGGSDLEYVPPSPKRATDHEAGSSSDPDDGDGRGRGRGRRGQSKRRRKSSAGTGGPTLKPKNFSSHQLNVMMRDNENLIERFNHYWICEECGAFFINKKDLRWHLNKHFKRYYCKLCTDSGSQFASVALGEIRTHIRRRHGGNSTPTNANAYSPQISPGLDKAEVDRKLNRKNFLTVEQLRNENREKYDELKKLPIVTLQDLMGNEEDEDEMNMEMDDDTVAVLREVEPEMPTTSGVTAGSSASAATAMGSNEDQEEDHEDDERATITVDEIIVKPESSHPTPRIREKRKSAVEAENKLAAWRLTEEDYDKIIDHPPEDEGWNQTPASRKRGSGGKKKTSDEKEEAKRPEEPEPEAPGPSVVDVAVAGPLQQANQNESQIGEGFQPLQASLSLTPENSEFHDNVAIEIEGNSAADGGNVSSEGAPVITNQDEGKGQSSSGTGGISHPLPEAIICRTDEGSVAGAEAAMVVVNQEETETKSDTLSDADSDELFSIAPSVRETGTPLTKDSKEELKKKKEKVKPNEGKQRKITPKRKSLPRSWKIPAPE